MTSNNKAPEFTLQDENGNPVSLSDFRGKTVVLFFYPRADTPGCTIEACEFRDSYTRLRSTGVVVLGISPDVPKDQKKFREKFELPYPLLCDPEKKVAEAMGVLKEKNMYGKKVMGIERSTFLIDDKGVRRQEWRKVKVPGHVEEVLEAARGL